MHRTLPRPLIVSPQSPFGEISLDPLPSTPRLSPAELAQAYRAWWFGTNRAGSLNGRTKR